MGSRKLVLTLGLAALTVFALAQLTLRLLPMNSLPAQATAPPGPLAGVSPPSPAPDASPTEAASSVSLQPSPAAAVASPVRAASAAPASASVAASRPAVAVPSASRGLQAQVSAILAALPAKSTAVFQELTGPERADRNGSAQEVAASVIKLPIAIEAIRQEDTGSLPASTSFTVKREDVVGGTGILQGQVGRTLGLQQLVDTTISYSDNVGANLLLKAVGGMDAVNRTMDSLGYPNTRVKRTLLDTQAEQRGIENLATAADVADMLARASRGQLLDASVSQAVMRVLKLRGQQTDPSLDFMGRQLVPRPSLAHINGELAGVRNDAGIVVTGQRAYVLSIFIHDPGHDDNSERAIADASAAIYRLETASQK